MVTCPLEVVKTRLQSSNPVFGNEPININSFVNGAGNQVRPRTLPPLGPPKLKSTGNYHDRSQGGRRAPFSTCASCGRSAQILAVPHHANPMPTSTVPKIGLVQCLR